MLNWLETDKAANLFTGMGAIATSLAVIIALGQAMLQVQRRRKEKLRFQADHVSAWLISDIGAGSQIAVANLSDAPVYNLVFTIVDGRNNDNDGRKMPNGVREYSVIAPPGRSFIFAQGGYGAAGFLPTLEVGFQDAAGRMWVRKSNGDLKRIKNQRVENYYKLELPVSWQSPRDKSEVKIKKVTDLR